MGTSGGRHEIRGVSGFDMLERQSLSSPGQRCVARALEGGGLVELRLLPHQPDLRRRDQLRERVSALTSVTSPHLVTVRGLVEVGDEMVLVTDAPPRTSVAEVLARRPLVPGEVVSLACGISAGLAELHRAGLAHGSVSPTSVRMTRAGRPVLSDIGSMSLFQTPSSAEQPCLDPWQPDAAAAAMSAAADVYAMAAMCLMSLAGSDTATLPRRQDLPEGLDPALLDILTGVLAAEPEQRPGAVELADALAAVAPAESLRVGAAAPAGDDIAGALRRRPRRVPRGRRAGTSGARSHADATALRSRRSRRRGASRLRLRWPLLLATVVVAVAGAGYAAQNTGSSLERPGGEAVAPTPPSVPGDGQATERPSTPSSPGKTAVGDWTAELTRLDALRAAAFEAGDTAALAALYTSDSGAGRRDLQTLRLLNSRGLRARGMRQTLVDVRPAVQAASTSGTPASGEVLLEVTDRLAVVELVDSRGVVRERRPARGEARWHVRLSRGPEGWRIADIVRA